MWSTETAWFDVAVIASIFAVGNVLFGHFEEHRPKWRRVLKIALLVGLAATMATLGLRWVTWAVVGALALAAGYVHLWWLPSHGVNGWTGEPRERYYELLGVRREEKET
jgi:hypothetical protein